MNGGEHLSLVRRFERSARFRWRRFLTDERRFRSVFPAARWERTQFSADRDTYSEWALISEPAPGETGASARLVELVARAGQRALEVDLSHLLPRARRSEERDQLQRWPTEHYRLLVALTEVFGARRVVEVGTYTGASALCFLEVPGTSVLTYDVVPWHEFDETMLVGSDFGPRLEQRIIDMGEAAACAAQHDDLAEADLVFVDGPKDGQFEYRFLPWLFSVEPRRPQLVVIDDIRVMSMIRLWRSMPLEKLDATTFGHWSGTGIVLRDSAVDWSAPSSADVG